MFSSKLTVISLMALLSVASAQYSPKANNVTILALGKSSNSTGGEGHAAAGGNLSPFGAIGVGCGVNWDNGKGYGGGLNAGSDDFGLGGGYKITPDTMEIGAGIGINPSNSTADFNFKGSVNGTFELVFKSTSSFACVPSNANGEHTVVCRTV